MMALEKHAPLRLSKAVLLHSAPVYHDVITCNSYDSSQSVYAQMFVSDLLEIGIVTAGQGISQTPQQSVPCSKGDVLIIPADMPHGYFVEEGEQMEVKRLMLDLKDWFEGDVVQQGSPHFCFGVFSDNAAVSYARLDAKTFGAVAKIIEQITNELSSRQKDWDKALESLLTMLLITLGRYVSNTIQHIAEIRQKEWRLVSPTIRLVSEQFEDSQLNLRGIAETLCVSQSHLSRVFRRVTGKAFFEYLRQTRLNYACDLLKETSLTVESIVEQCGLRDIPAFYRSFRNYTGLTPKQYRNKNKININEGDIIMVILSEISENLQKGRGKVVKDLVQQAIDEGSNPEQILNEGLLNGMSVIGEKFKNNEIYVPEVLVAARAMNMGVQILKPYLAQEGVTSIGRVCLGTVQGDLHDIGKNLVKMMMEGKGLEVIDLGTDVPAETFVKTAIEQDCKIICCSALLTTTMGVMEEVVKAATEAGIRDKVKIMIGGAPVNEEYCNKIGADCYTVDAASAADAAVAFCKE